VEPNEKIEKSQEKNGGNLEKNGERNQEPEKSVPRARGWTRVQKESGQYVSSHPATPTAI